MVNVPASARLRWTDLFTHREKLKWANCWMKFETIDGITILADLKSGFGIYVSAAAPALSSFLRISKLKYIK